jgi:hypothetical protein
VIEALAGKDAREQTREMFRGKLKRGELDDTMIEIDVADSLRRPADGLWDARAWNSRCRACRISVQGLRWADQPQADDRGCKATTS